MTREEADRQNWLDCEEAIDALEWVYQNGFENDPDIFGTDRILDAIREGIDALWKQTPKKIVTSIETVNAFTAWIKYLCPSCNRFIWSGTDKPPVPQKACHYCGQLLDWGE